MAHQAKGDSMTVDEMLRDLVREVVREELAKRQTPSGPELITAAEFARRRSISKSTVRAAIREGRLEVTRIGRAVRIAADAQIGRPGGSARGAERREAARRKLLGY
jgi:excisionase family DNA binding protein